MFEKICPGTAGLFVINLDGPKRFKPEGLIQHYSIPKQIIILAPRRSRGGGGGGGGSFE